MDFGDLAFEVDASENTITIHYGSSDNKIVLRNAADLIDENDNQLLTANDFHFLPGNTDRNVVLSDGGLELRGRGSDDVLEGAGGNNILRGRRGDDILEGGGGNDILRGGRGDDALYGGVGDDILTGGLGSLHSDEMWGGIGSDTFAFRQGDGADRIFDFEVGTDTIAFLAETEVNPAFGNLEDFTFGFNDLDLRYWASGDNPDSPDYLDGTLITFKEFELDEDGFPRADLYTEILVAGVRPEQLTAEDFDFLTLDEYRDLLDF